MALIACGWGSGLDGHMHSDRQRPCFPGGPAGPGEAPVQRYRGEGICQGEQDPAVQTQVAVFQDPPGAALYSAGAKGSALVSEICASAGQLSGERRMRRAQLCFPGPLENLGRGGPLQVQSGALHSPNALHSGLVSPGHAERGALLSQNTLSSWAGVHQSMGKQSIFFSEWLTIMDQFSKVVICRVDP